MLSLTIIQRYIVTTSILRWSYSQVCNSLSNHLLTYTKTKASVIQPSRITQRHILAYVPWHQKEKKSLNHDLTARVLGFASEVKHRLALLRIHVFHEHPRLVHYDNRKFLVNASYNKWTQINNCKGWQNWMVKESLVVKITLKSICFKGHYRQKVAVTLVHTQSRRKSYSNGMIPFTSASSWLKDHPFSLYIRDIQSLEERTWFRTVTLPKRTPNRSLKVHAIKNYTEFLIGTLD